MRSFGSFCQRLLNNESGNLVKLSCDATRIICRHIFRVASQLNLTRLPDSLFNKRWQKDPNDLILMQQFNSFCNGNSAINDFNNSGVEISEDYEYLLSKPLYDIKNLVKKHPELSKKFYLTNNTLLKNKLKI